MALADVHERERRHHDELAAQLAPELMPPREPDRFEQPLLDAVGEIAGKHVLDLGCGDGGLSFHLVDRGADVTALDISPGMVEVARRRLEHFRPEASVRLVAAPIEASGLKPGSFDLIVGRWILHHLDLHQGAEAIAALLKPGGRGVFFENHAGNPLLRLARRHLAGRFGIPRLGTVDEHLLERSDYECWRARFSSVELVWPDFYFFGLLNRQVLRYRFPRMNRWSVRADGWVFDHLKALRPYGYHVVVRLAK
jgi:SAM-dependent methyltransferase